MNLPIRFPSDADVIADEVRRFRALTPEERVQTINEMFHLYHFLANASGQPETVARLAEEEKTRERQAIREFVARHA